MNKQFKFKSENFTPVSKNSDDTKYNIYLPEKYKNIINELNTINYNIDNKNYDNLMDLDDFNINKPNDSVSDILNETLKIQTETLNYKIASISSELSKKNKQAINYRSYFNSENFKKSSGLDEELNETYNREWYDRDQLDLYM